MGWGFKNGEIAIDVGRWEGGGLRLVISKKTEPENFWLTKVIIFIQIYDKSLFCDKSDNFQTKVINYMTKVILPWKKVTKGIFSLLSIMYIHITLCEGKSAEQLSFGFNI